MRLGDLQLLNPIKASELCVQYCARDAQQKLVEVRVICDNASNSPDWEGLVKRLRLAAMSQHATLQRLLAVETEQRPAFVVLEPPPSHNLAVRNSEHPLSLLDSVRQARQLSIGLTVSHRLGLAHGRICPQTIFVDDNGEWVIDVTGLDRNTEIGPAFCAPEMTEVDGVELATDVYGLAAVLRWLVPAASACQPLLDACLSNDPSVRPTAAELAERLNEILAALAGSRLEIANQETIDPSATVSPLAKTAQPFDQTIAQPPGTTPRFPTKAEIKQLGPYELVEKLGEGGMGTVYRARDVADGTTVAVKVIHAAAADKMESRRRFAKEARMLARANNPYVANLLAFNDDSGIGYLAVEFVPGGSVGAWLKKQERYDERAAVALIADVARGLLVAHQRGIIHRDIKPDNLLLTEAGTEFLEAAQTKRTTAGIPLVKLSDFGLARSDRQSESLAITVDGAVMGTPYYMSPEQCRGLPADARSDVYSLGATLFHMLVGRPPFDAETHVAVLHKHCHDPAPVLRKLVPEVSDAIDRVVAKCLAKNPDARYAHAGELLDDIERIYRGTPTSIVLHPQLPDTGGSDVLTFEFEWELSSSPAQLWPFVSHTDRLNQAMGLPSVRFTTNVDPQRGVRRFADATVAGQRLNWEEYPYEWIEGRRMSVLRVFAKGPFRWFVNIVEMEPRAGGGTLLKQTFQLRPLNFVGKWLAKLEIGRKSKKTLTRIYEQMDRYLAAGRQDDPTSDAFRKPAELSAQRRARLQQRLERLRKCPLDPIVVETLGQFLEHGSDQEVARIRPLAFAARFRLDPAQTVAACLWGAREGMLLLLWDILCPSCRIPSDVKETLAALKDHGHCEACNVDFDLDFNNSVEAIFRAHPEFRDVETRTYCIGGPAFSPHVVAQSRLTPGERFEMELALEEGAYRVRGPQLPFVVDLRVSPAGPVGRWDLSLSRPPMRDLVPLLKPHAQVITLVNDTHQELFVRLERAASKADALTAAHAASLALFREIFPGQVLSQGQIVSVTSITLLLAQIHDAGNLYRKLGDGAAFESVRQSLHRIHTAVEKWGGAVVKILGDGVVASFNDTGAAVKTALELMGEPNPDSISVPLQLAIHRGPAMVTTMNDRLDYFGNSVHIAHELLATAGPQELFTTDAVAGLPEVHEMLREKCHVDVLPRAENETAGIVHRCRPLSR